MSKAKNTAGNNEFVIHICFHNEENIILYVPSRVYLGSTLHLKLPFFL